ncbi:uncharacterized protein LOC131224839 isoform X2 [Magnolia sinica]|uniref:uncharacterized protein LOC131224839 isoform X2 n=1 Tax=Magnolia sinica TaxID=86752 RepID=UPI002657E269|nr:uncharacterized protein LOC131224839 isoform X2 [Magnolia sinica]
MIQISSKSRRFATDFSVLISLHSHRFLDGPDNFDAFRQWQLSRRFSFQNPRTTHVICIPSTTSIQHLDRRPTCSMTTSACLTSKESGIPTEIVKELYIKMLKSMETETMPPNAWLCSLIENCGNREDIMLLFQILQELQRFRLSNLRIFANFNCQLCLRVARACAHVGAVDFGMRTLWEHNVYGLTPSICSAHHLLCYAKEHNDFKLMVEIMQLLKKNSLPLQPGTADIVFSICYNTDNWALISKYSKRFIKDRVKLHRTAFDIWMEFAAKVGDAESIWKIEKLRSNSWKQHSLASGFSCAKGYLLEHKPENAATIIHMLNQTLPDWKKKHIAAELQRLGSEWPLEVIKKQKKENRKALAKALRSDVTTMVESLLSMGLEVTMSLKDLIREEDITC